MANEIEKYNKTTSFWSSNIDSIVCSIGFLLIIRFGNVAILILAVLAYLAFVLEFVSRKNYSVAFRILTVTSVISGIDIFLLNYYTKISIAVFITNIVACGIIELIIIHESNKFFEENCYEIAEKYRQAKALLNQHKGLNSYKKLIDNIYNEDKKLYLASMPIRDALKKVTKLINDMSTDDSFKPKKKLFVRSSEVESDKLYNSNRYMKAALQKQKEYSDYIEEVDSAIKATGTDFLNVRAELELAELSHVSIPEISLSKLEQRSKTLAYIQSHLPAIN